MTHARWCADLWCQQCYCLGKRILETWPICKEREVDGRLEEYQIATGVKVEP